MFNPTRRELRDEQRYLEDVLGPNIARYEAARLRALLDARRTVARRFHGEDLMLIDYGLKPTLESRNADGFCEAGSIIEGGGDRRCWLVRWNPWKGQRMLRRVG